MDYWHVVCVAANGVVVDPDLPTPFNNKVKLVADVHFCVLSSRLLAKGNPLPIASSATIIHQGKVTLLVK